MRLRIRELKDLDEGDIVGGVMLEPESVVGPCVEVYQKARIVRYCYQHKYVTSCHTIGWLEEGGVVEQSDPIPSYQEFLVIQP